MGKKSKGTKEVQKNRFGKRSWCLEYHHWIPPPLPRGKCKGSEGLSITLENWVRKGKWEAGRLRELRADKNHTHTP